MNRPEICIYLSFALTLILSVRPAAPRSQNNDVPTITASYRTEEIRIDGRITEGAWLKAVPATNFVQGEPVEGAAAQERTEVRVLYDEAALYIGAVLYDRKPGRIGDQLVRRDEHGAYDYFEVSLDPNNDRLTGFTFRVSAAGVQGDAYLFNDVRDDVAWDAVWSSEVHRDSFGWSTEIRIPLSQLRYNASDSLQSWGVNFSRRRLAENELTFFALQSRLQHGKVSVFGRLTGLRFPRGSRRFEVKPYALASTNRGPSEENDPFFDGTEFSTQTGLDISYGLGKDYNLDVTINPDFGQVEVDPAIINLTEFETFFPEKRPFFVKDAQLFDFDLSGRRNQLFYSRRIGREPQAGGPNDADFEDVPTRTTILGAAKLTGRSASGLSLGALAALTSETKGTAFFDSTGTLGRFPVEPLSLYSVVRARQDFREGASQVGAIMTLTHRDLPEDGSLDFLATDAYSVGADFEFNWGGPRSRNWAFLGHAVGTYIKGSPTALTEIQTSSTHYFQRPDAQRFRLDSTATTMNGLEWQLEFQRRSGQHWTGSAWINQRTPGFETNDIGFLSSGEGVSGGTRISYREIKPGSLFRSYRIRIFAVHDWRHRIFNDFSWDSARNAYDGGRWSASSELEFLNYWRLGFELSHSPERLSDTATRGGPLMVVPGNVGFEIRGNTDRRKKMHFSPSFDYQDGLRGGFEWRTRLGITFRPSPGWQIELRPAFNRELDPAQYVETTDVLGYAETFGNRYIFGELKQSSFSIESRVNVTFSPKLTIQLYGQQLISSGRYETYKQLLRPESFDFDVLEEGTALVRDGSVSCFDGRTCVDNEERYIDFDADGNIDFSFADEDFNVRSLKLNAVLRWEYRPGSTLFLVWQHTRFSEENIGTFDLRNSLSRLWRTQPDNAVILKLNYWFDL